MRAFPILATAATWLLLSGLALATPPGAALARGGENMILNGDFENHSFGPVCYWLPNAEFNAGVSNVTGFGEAEIGLMSDETCFYLPPQSGATNLEIAIYSPFPYGGSEASMFSFDLSSPIVAGELYRIEFYAFTEVDYEYSLGGGGVNIGISASPTGPGTTVFTGWPPSELESGWTLLSTTFVAPIAANYLTVAPQWGDGGLQHLIHIDNFSLVADEVSPDPYTWTISANANDPDANSAPYYAPGLQHSYLWLKCCPGSGVGMVESEFSLFWTDQANVLINLITYNGFTFQGFPNDLALSVSGCPCGPVLVGELTSFVSVPGSLCFGLVPPGIPPGAQFTRDCSQIPHVMSWTGLAYGGDPCFSGVPCGPVSVNPSSWGRIKGLYRE